MSTLKIFGQDNQEHSFETNSVGKLLESIRDTARSFDLSGFEDAQPLPFPPEDVALLYIDYSTRMTTFLTGGQNPELTGDGLDLIRSIPVEDRARVIKQRFGHNLVIEQQERDDDGTRTSGLKQNMLVYSKAVSAGLIAGNKSKESANQLVADHTEILSGLLAHLNYHGHAADAFELCGYIFKSIVNDHGLTERKLIEGLAQKIEEEELLPQNWAELYAEEISAMQNNFLSKREEEISTTKAALEATVTELEQKNNAYGELHAKNKKSSPQANALKKNLSEIAKKHEELEKKLKSLKSTKEAEFNQILPRQKQMLCEAMAKSLLALEPPKNPTQQDITDQIQQLILFTTQAALPEQFPEKTAKLYSNLISPENLEITHYLLKNVHAVKSIACDSFSEMLRDVSLKASSCREATKPEVLEDAIEVPAGTYAFTPHNTPVGSSGHVGTTFIHIKHKYGKAPSLTINADALHNPTENISAMLADYRAQPSSTDRNKTVGSFKISEFDVTVIGVPHNIPEAIKTFKKNFVEVEGRNGKPFTDEEFTDKVMESLADEDQKMCLSVRSVISSLVALAQDGYIIRQAVIGRPEMSTNFCLGLDGKKVELYHNTPEHFHPLSRLAINDQRDVFNIRSTTAPAPLANGLPCPIGDALANTMHFVYKPGDTYYSSRPQLIFDKGQYQPFPIVRETTSGIYAILHTQTFGNISEFNSKNGGASQADVAADNSVYFAIKGLVKIFMKNLEYPGLNQSAIDFAITRHAKDETLDVINHNMSMAFTQLISSPPVISVGPSKELEGEICPLLKRAFSTFISEPGQPASHPSILIIDKTTNQVTPNRAALLLAEQDAAKHAAKLLNPTFRAQNRGNEQPQAPLGTFGASLPKISPANFARTNSSLAANQLVNAQKSNFLELAQIKTGLTESMLKR